MKLKIFLPILTIILSLFLLCSCDLTIVSSDTSTETEVDTDTSGNQSQGARARKIPTEAKVIKVAKMAETKKTVSSFVYTPTD